MNYIIEITEGIFFAGWDANLGTMKTIDDISLAYRMRRPTADVTLGKVIQKFGTGRVMRI